MKKIFFSALVGICTLWIFQITSAYNPSSGDTQQVNLLKTQLDIISSGNMQDVWSFYSQIKILLKNYWSDEQLNWMLSQINVHLYDKLTREKNKAKIISKQAKQEFLATYLTSDIKEISEKLSCTGRYNTLDNISFAYNFPTALTIATRYRETSCGYYLPANGDGPFQIVSKDYGTWEITEELFTKSVEDFITFSKAKHTQYKTKLWINLTYTGFDWTGLVNHAGLYNGGLISGNIVNPYAPKYLRDGYGLEYSGAVRHGLIPKFLKTLQWEIGSQY